MQDDIVRGGVPVPLVTQPSDSARILFFGSHVQTTFLEVGLRRFANVCDQALPAHSGGDRSRTVGDENP